MAGRFARPRRSVLPTLGFGAAGLTYVRNESELREAISRAAEVIPVDEDGFATEDTAAAIVIADSFTISQTIEFPSQVPGLTIEGRKGYKIRGAVDLFDPSAGGSVTFRGVHFAGTAAALSWSGISFSGLVLDGCTFANSLSSAISGGGLSSALIFGCEIGADITIGSGNSNRIIANNVATSGWSMSIGAAGTVIFGNDFASASGSVTVTGTGANAITGNIFGGTGLTTSGSSGYNTIFGNTFSKGAGGTLTEDTNDIANTGDQSGAYNI